MHDNLQNYIQKRLQFGQINSESEPSIASESESDFTMESIQNDKIINEYIELIWLIVKCILKIENPLDMVNCLLQDLNQFLGQI